MEWLFMLSAASPAASPASPTSPATSPTDASATDKSFLGKLWSFISSEDENSPAVKLGNSNLTLKERFTLNSEKIENDMTILKNRNFNIKNHQQYGYFNAFYSGDVESNPTSNKQKPGSSNVGFWHQGPLQEADLGLGSPNGVRPLEQTRSRSVVQAPSALPMNLHELNHFSNYTLSLLKGNSINCDKRDFKMGEIRDRLMLRNNAAQPSSSFDGIYSPIIKTSQLIVPLKTFCEDVDLIMEQQLVAIYSVAQSMSNTQSNREALVAIINKHQAAIQNLKAHLQQQEGAISEKQLKLTRYNKVVKPLLAEQNQYKTAFADKISDGTNETSVKRLSTLQTMITQIAQKINESTRAIYPTLDTCDFDSEVYGSILQEEMERYRDTSLSLEPTIRSYSVMLSQLQKGSLPRASSQKAFYPSAQITYQNWTKKVESFIKRTNVFKDWCDGHYQLLNNVLIDIKTKRLTPWIANDGSYTSWDDVNSWGIEGAVDLKASTYHDFAIMSLDFSFSKKVIDLLDKASSYLNRLESEDKQTYAPLHDLRKDEIKRIVMELDSAIRPVAKQLDNLKENIHNLSKSWSWPRGVLESEEPSRFSHTFLWALYRPYNLIKSRYGSQLTLVINKLNNLISEFDLNTATTFP